MANMKYTHRRVISTSTSIVILSLVVVVGIQSLVFLMLNTDCSVFYLLFVTRHWLA